MKLFIKIFGITVKIYMKSGNVITLKHLKELNIDSNGNGITYLKITKLRFWRFFKHEELLVESVDLSQVEAITSI